MFRRSFTLTLQITNGTLVRLYAVRPLSPPQLASPFVAGVLLRVLGEAGPTYSVCMAIDGQVVCTCPSWNHNDAQGKAGCKHCDACIAAGLVPVALVQMVHARNALLDQAEAEAEALRLALHRAEQEARQIEQALLAAEAELTTLKKKTRRTRKVAA